MRHADHPEATAGSVLGSFRNVARVVGSAVAVAVLVGACSAEGVAPAGDASPPGPDEPAVITSAPPSAVAVGEAGSSAQPPAVAPSRAPRVPGPSVPRVAPLQPPAYASRVVVSDYGIDLPVISGDLQPPPSYPLCDVAAFVTRFNQPYENGVTYISAHAQQGMFEPLLIASQEQDGQQMIGKRVDVYTSDGRRFIYSIERVVRHALDYAVVNTLSLDARTLILQTSEGPYGTEEKLQVIASFVEETTADAAEANPAADPRDCRPPELGGASPTP